MPEPRNPPTPAAPAPDPSAPDPSAPGSAAALPPPEPTWIAEAADSVLITVHAPAGASPAARRRIADLLAPAARRLLDPRTE